MPFVAFAAHGSGAPGNGALRFQCWDVCCRSGFSDVLARRCRGMVGLCGETGAAIAAIVFHLDGDFSSGNGSL